MPSDGQLEMKGGDVKRNVPERKYLSQQVKLFHISKNISPCREGPCPCLGGRGQPAPPSRSREAAGESGAHGTEPVLARSAEAAGLWAFGGKLTLFPPLTTLLGPSAPQ